MFAEQLQHTWRPRGHARPLITAANSQGAPCYCSASDTRALSTALKERAAPPKGQNRPWASHGSQAIRTLSTSGRHWVCNRAEQRRLLWRTVVPWISSGLADKCWKRQSLDANPQHSSILHPLASSRMQSASTLRSLLLCFMFNNSGCNSHLCYMTHPSHLSGLYYIMLTIYCAGYKLRE
jgi:endonuclease I